jgi:hypothetical protein
MPLSSIQQIRLQRLELPFSCSPLFSPLQNRAAAMASNNAGTASRGCLNFQICTVALNTPEAKLKRKCARMSTGNYSSAESLKGSLQPHG